MKITAKQFAQALYESVAGKNKTEVKKAIAELANVLRENNGLNLQEKIIKNFILIFNKEEGIVEAEVTSFEKLGLGTKKDLEACIKKITAAQKIEIKENEDKSIIGGTIIKYGDKILDASLKTKIQSLKSELKK